MEHDTESDSIELDALVATPSHTSTSATCPLSATGRHQVLNSKFQTHKLSSIAQKETTMSALPPLLRLPRELRDEIYAYVFDDFPHQRLRINKYHNVHERIITPPLKALPPICATSLQLYFETTPYFLLHITLLAFNLQTTCWLRRWFATFPNSAGYISIQRLAFRNFHGPEQIKGYELLSLCPNIRSLNIMFGDEFSDPGMVPSLAISSLSSAINAYESFDNVLLMRQFHRIIELPKLEVFEFGFHDWEEPVSWPKERQIEEWLGMKCREKGRDIRVVCKRGSGGR
jgi:hypothetical protein